MQKSEFEHLVDMMNEAIEQVKRCLPAFVKAVKKINDSFVDAGDGVGCNHRYTAKGVYSDHESQIWRCEYCDDEITISPKSSPPEVERWEVKCDEKGEVGLYINGKREAIILADGLSPGHLRTMAAAPQMRDALKLVKNSNAMFTREEWKIIEAALEKGGG